MVDQFRIDGLLDIVESLENDLRVRFKASVARVPLLWPEAQSKSAVDAVGPLAVWVAPLVEHEVQVVWLLVREVLPEQHLLVVGVAQGRLVPGILHVGSKPHLLVVARVVIHPAWLGLGGLAAASLLSLLGHCWSGTGCF